MKNPKYPANEGSEIYSDPAVAFIHNLSLFPSQRASVMATARV